MRRYEYSTPPPSFEDLAIDVFYGSSKRKIEVWCEYIKCCLSSSYTVGAKQSIVKHLKVISMIVWMKEGFSVPSVQEKTFQFANIQNLLHLCLLKQNFIFWRNFTLTFSFNIAVSKFLSILKICMHAYLRNSTSVSNTFRAINVPLSLKTCFFKRAF